MPDTTRTTNPLSAVQREEMLDRYARGGGNPSTGERILDEILDAHNGVNLDAALHYWGFVR